MSLDPTRNFLKQTLATGYSLSETAITLPDATRFPNPDTDGHFNLVWWNVTDYTDPTDDPNKEIVRVTAISGNIATITRGQEGTTATAKNLSGKTYQIALTLTKKTMDDIDTTLETVTGAVANHEMRIDTAEEDITQIEGDLGVVEGAISSLQSGKQDNLGFTPENVTNKENTTLDTSTTKYPTNRLVKEGLDAKQNSLGFTPENVANKSTNVSTDGSSDTKYPSVKAIKDYADNLVAGLLDYRGGYDASVNTFPTTNGSGTAGAIKKGDMFIISVAGTLGGNAVQVGDSLIASVDTPGQTSGNWNILNANIFYVPENVENKVKNLNEPNDITYPTTKTVKDELNLKPNSSDLATVATSGDYNDLVNKPLIPEDIDDLTDTSGIIPKDIDDLTDTNNLLFSGDYDDLSNKPSTFPPSAHTHTINQVTGLQDALDANADAILKTSSTTSTATLTPSNTTATNYYLTAQGASLTIANPTLNIGQKIVIWVKDNGTARAISFGSDYKVFVDNPLPTTTVVGKWMQIIIDKVDTNVVFVSHTVEA